MNEKCFAGFCWRSTIYVLISIWTAFAVQGGARFDPKANAGPQVQGAATAPTSDWKPPLDQALRRARSRHAPILLVFHAGWCAPCLAMAQHVLNGPEWDVVQRNVVFVSLDADSPEGTYWQHRFGVGLPSFVVFNENGSELGRIQGEQIRAEFYRRLNDILSGEASMDVMRRKVVDGSRSSLKAATELLEAYRNRGDDAGALGWLQSLPSSLRVTLQEDAVARLEIRRLRLLKAENARDSEQCLSLGRQVLKANLGCDRSTELGALMYCTASVSSAGKAALLNSQKTKMSELLAKHILVATPDCPEPADAVLQTADLYRALGDAKGEAAVLKRAIVFAKKGLGDNVLENRSLATDLTSYLERAGDTKELDLLYSKMMTAYPDEMIYPYRYGRSLVARGKFEEALPILQKAAKNSYGANSLMVAILRARVLLKLGRSAEAKQVAADALKDSGPWFPSQAKQLEQVLMRETGENKRG